MQWMAQGVIRRNTLTKPQRPARPPLYMRHGCVPIGGFPRARTTTPPCEKPTTAGGKLNALL